MLSKYIQNKLVIMGTSILMATPVFAGGWVSGGGELIRDKNNPWFVSNTQSVKYCVHVNEKQFGQSKQFVSEKVAKAFAFWKRQLSELSYFKYGGSTSTLLGTQDFNEVTCAESPDIVFQMAYLTADQKQRMGDLSKTIAVTVRTDYDEVNLRGKGFIYFNNNEQFSLKPWTLNEGSRIFPILIHEIGHIFGINHDPTVQFMAEDYAENLLNTDPDQIKMNDQFTAWLNQGENDKSIHLFKYSESKPMYEFMMCSTSSIFPIPTPIPKPKLTNVIKSGKGELINMISVYDQFFGILPEHNCQSISIQDSKLKIFSGKDKVSLVGEAHLKMKDFDSLIDVMENQSLIRLWLPSKQKVFVDKQVGSFKAESKINIAYFKKTQLFKGTYETIDQKIKRPITIETTNNGGIRRISGLYKGEIYNNLQEGY